MFNGMVPPLTAHPFAAAPASPATSPRAGESGAGPAAAAALPAGASPLGGQVPQLLLGPFAGLPGLSKPMGMSGGGWQDPSVLRRSDLEVVIENFRAHIEERFEKQTEILAQVVSGQQQQREMQDQLLQRLKPLVSLDWKTLSGRIMGAEGFASEMPPNQLDAEGSVENIAEALAIPAGDAGEGESDEERTNSKPKGRSPGRFDEGQEECWVDRESRVGTYHRYFSSCVESTHFDYVMGFFIVLNTVFLGIQIDIKAYNLQQPSATKQEPVFFSAIETTFATIFLMELIARLISTRHHFCLSGWNLFDFLVVAASLLEECIKYGIGGDTIAGKISVFRIMRVVKLLRTLRIIRVVRAFRELRIVLLSIARSVRALVWTLGLFFVIIYFMTVLILVELTSAENAYVGTDQMAALRREHFPSMARTLITVYQCTTGGLLWSDASGALGDVIPWIASLWIAYIGFAYFAISNVVTGIFVDQAMKSAHEDMRNVEVEEFDKREGAINHLRNILTQSIVMGRTFLDRTTMQRVCREKTLQKFFQKYEIDPRDMCTLFDIIAGDKQVIPVRDLDPFIYSCFRLKGFARSIDVAAVSFNLKKLVRKRKFA